MYEHVFVKGNARFLATRRLEATPPLAATDGHFLAGFIEAEGSFCVRPNNGGQNWNCSMSLKVRDDDMALIGDLMRLTGLGHINRVPAHRTSNPQVRWQVVSRTECLRLAELLRDFPLRGRKRREAAVWSRAVRDLAKEPRPRTLPLAQAELRALRRYVNADERQPEPVSLPDDTLVPFLGGFFTGEGHLFLSPNRCRVVVRVRDDDRSLLEALVAATGLGSIYLARAYASSRPAAAWVIHRRDHMRPAVDLLGRAGLRGRKLREFEVWREAALEHAKPPVARSRRTIEEACAALAEARTYRSPQETIVESDHRLEQQRAYVEVLIQAARCACGNLTGPTYAAARSAHPSWPTRNTIARAFGSWAGALEAAGLHGHCSARARSKAVEAPRDYTDEQLAQRGAARSLVLRAVGHLNANGRESSPTVHQYLEYRAANDPALPSLSRLYDLFPGGWHSVLKQAAMPSLRSR
jgi:hypothetical protein